MSALPANRIRPPRVAVLIVAALTAIPAGATELLLTWGTGFDSSIDAQDVNNYYGGSSSTALSLSSGGLSASVPYVVNYPGGYSTTFDATAGGSVTFGYISGAVTAIVSGDGDGLSGAAVNAGFGELVTINNPALTGQQGSMTAAILLDVSPGLITQNSGPPGVQSQVILDWYLYTTGTVLSSPGGTITGHYTEDDETPEVSYICGAGPTCLDPAPGSVLIPLTWSFTFGQSFSLDMQMSAFATATGTGYDAGSFAAEGSLNFLNTVAWQGITSVTQGDGSPVDFTITSESGTDYTQAITAVPAPAGLWLLGSGIVALAARRRRQIK